MHNLGAQAPNPQAIQQAQAQCIKFCIQYASIALVYHDYILTLKLEIAFIWRSKFRFSTLLYILTRYSMIANILYLMAISKKLSNCDTWYRVIGVLSVLGRASVIFVFCARTYAIWNRSQLVLAGLGILGLGCILLDGLHIPGLKCQGSSTSQIQATLLSIMVCVLELAVALLTVYNAVKSPNIKFFRSSQSMGGFIIQQGVLYFCGAFIFTFSAMILNFVVKPDNFMVKLLNALTLPFSCLLTSRFILHLRAFLAKDAYDMVTLNMDESVISTLNFGMVEEFGVACVDPDDAADRHGNNDEAEMIHDEIIEEDRENNQAAVASGSGHTV